MPTTYYFWDPLEDNIVQERDESGTVSAEYTTEPGLYGNVISQNRGGEYKQYHYDAQGSVIAVTDENQNVTDTLSYSAFGELTERTGTTVLPFQYLGQKGYYRDQFTGEYIVRERPYHPAQGRWLTPDRLGFIEGINRFLYVGNNPILYFDPSGLAKDCPPGCCKVTAFSVDPPNAKCASIQNKETGQIDFVAEFRVTAEFSSGAGLDCGCCSYRQEIKGLARYRMTGGEWTVAREVPDFVEDCTIDEMGIEQCYGDRSAAERTNDVYSHPDRKTGCKYASYDAPGLYDLRRAIEQAISQGKQLELEIDLTFRLRVNDYCCLHAAKDLPTIEYPVKCSAKVPRR